MRIAICGQGRSGKDTASNWLSEHTTLSYHGSTSEAAAMLCFKDLEEKYGYRSVEEAFQDRHNHREEWAKCIWLHNCPDGLTLYRGMLMESDILNGIRRSQELEALHSNDLIDLTIWIDRDVPNDPSCELTARNCDIIIPNHDSIDAFYTRLHRLSKALSLLE